MLSLIISNTNILGLCSQHQALVHVEAILITNLVVYSIDHVQRIYLPKPVRSVLGMLNNCLNA